MDIKVQIEVVAIVGVLAAIALFKGNVSIADVVAGGLLGFLSGQAIAPKITNNDSA